MTPEMILTTITACAQATTEFCKLGQMPEGQIR